MRRGGGGWRVGGVMKKREEIGSQRLGECAPTKSRGPCEHFAF